MIMNIRNDRTRILEKDLIEVGIELLGKAIIECFISKPKLRMKN